LTTPARKRKKRVSPHRALLAAHRKHYDWMLAQQGGGCGICGRAPSETRKLDMDHDHKRMFVRGLLCHTCNRALTYRVDSPEWLESAAKYLKKKPFSFPKDTNSAQC